MNNDVLDNKTFTEAWPSCRTHRSFMARPWAANMGGKTRYFGSANAARRYLLENMDISRPVSRRVVFMTSPRTGIVAEKW
jgi:hypothetical protein